MDKILRKITALVFVFIFVLQPMAPLFAQEASALETTETSDVNGILTPDVETTEPIAEPVEPIETISVPFSDVETSAQAPSEIPMEEPGAVEDPIIEPETESEIPVEKEPESQDMAVLDQSDSTQVSNNFGLAQKLPEIDKNTGSLIYNYPISVPPGRNNFQPDIVLSYNSNLNNQNSILGYGWSLSIPYIKRLSKNGIDELYNEYALRYFYSSIDGELVITGGSSYAPKTENGSFNKYTFSNNQWLITAKDGRQYKFGYNESSQQNDPANPGDVYKWMLQEIRDTNDNYISYTYFKDAGQIYPLAIKYTGNGGTAGIFEINFSREARLDNMVAYNTGFSVAANYRINQIIFSVNGNWVNKYDLVYSAGSGGVRSVLRAITESAKNEAGNIIAKPQTSFGYSNNLSHDNTTLNLPAALQRYLDYVEYADVNGDGLTDILISACFSAADQIYITYLNDGNGGWTESPSYMPPKRFVEISGSFRRIPHFFTDINGDNLLDLIYGEYDKPIGFTLYMNTGSGWLEDNTTFPKNLFGGLNGEGIFMDINGDGLEDFFKSADSNLESQTVLLNRGSYFYQAVYSPPKYTDSITGQSTTYYLNRPDNSSYGVIPADVNGDGILDVMVSYSQVINRAPYHEEIKKTYLGDGKSNAEGNFYLSDAYAPPTLFSFHGGWDYNMGVKVMDYNGDGLADLVQSAKNVNLVLNPVLPEERLTAQRVFLNTGKGWAPPFDIVLPYYFVVGAGFNKSFAFGNFDGKNANEIYKSTGELHTISNNEGADLLNSVSLNAGGSVNISYKPSAVLKNADGNFLNPELPVLLYVVSKIETTDPVNNITSAKNYQYAGGTYYYNGAFDRNIAGFAQIDETDSQGDITKNYYHTADESNSAKGEYQDSYYKIGKAYRIEQYDASGNLYRVNINKWDIYDLGSNESFVKLIQSVEKNYDGRPSHKDKAESYAYENNTGNLSQKIEWGEVLANDDGSFTDVGNDKRATDISYAVGSAVLGDPSNIIVTGQSNNKIKETRYYYDNLALGSISLGNQTKEEKWVGGGVYVNTQKIYNNLGLVTQSTDANGNAANFVYDSYNLYPATVTNALNQIAQYIYNYANGKVAQVTDANGNTFKNTFDGFGRILKTEQPDQNTPATLAAKTAYVYNDASGNVSSQQTNYLDSSNSVNVYNYYDGLGRIIQTKKSAENNNFETKDFVYDNRGNLQKESLPYFSSGSAKTASTSTAQLYATYIYDVLNRKTSIANAVGATSYAYKNWQTTITDTNQKQKDYFYDAYNNLTEVREHNGADIYITAYVYDPAGNLILITDALGNVRNFTYDGLGRRLTAQDLHNPADSVFGVYNYTYDNAGNLISLTDPKNQTINYLFDALNRKTSEDYIGQEGVEITFNYDNCPNGKGLLCDTNSAGIVEQFEYSATGNITKDTKIIGEKTFITQYSYDRMGNQILITNPDNSEIKYDYNSAGLIEKVWGVVNNFDYSPAEQATSIVYANGTQTTNTYDSAKLYRLTNKVTTNTAGTQLQNLAYTYDAVGNITQLVDNSATDAKKTVVYAYDDLYRLLSSTATNVASGQQAYTQSFTYDALGNILTQTKNGETTTYEYEGSNPDAVTKTVTNLVLAYTAKHKIFEYITPLNFTKKELLSLPAFIRPMGGGAAAAAAAPSPAPAAVQAPLEVTAPVEAEAEIPAETSAAQEPSLLDSATGALSLPIIIKSGSATPKINSFTADKTTIEKGESATLSWTLSGKEATTLAINNVGSVLGKTSKVVKPSVTTTYTMLAGNRLGKSIKSVTITVIPPTKITKDYQYDANGNMISDGVNTYEYDYNNRLISATTPTATINYAYDISGQRVKVANSATITYYPTKFYNTDNAEIPSATKHIFANGVDIATVQGTGTNAKIYYTSTDSLNSSSIMTDSAGTIAETMDYYPFGGIRLDVKPEGSTFTEQRKYIGQEFDADTGLNYLNARYYNAAIGRFTAQDPVFWGKQNLADPQSLNSYSYANNNPVVMSDPSGLIPTALEAAFMANQIYQNGHEGDNLTGGWQFNSLLDSSGTGMKMGVYSRTQNGTQCVPLEYALVSKGTTNFSDWKNNFGQALWASSDLDVAVKRAVGFVNDHSNNETTFVGHSKAGPEAEASALSTNKNAILFNPAPFNASKYNDKISAYTAQINEYIVRGEAINLTLNNLANPLNSRDNVTYLPSQYSLSWSQIRQQGLFSAVRDNAVKNHSMEAVIYGLNKINK